MKSEISYLLDFLFPRSGFGSTNIHGYLSQSFIENSAPFFKSIDVEGKRVVVLAASSYQRLEVKDLIHRSKFEGELAILEDLTNLVEDKLVKSGLLSDKDVFTFVPPDPKRWRQRGYHTPALLAQKVALRLGLPCENLFVKNRHTKSQVEMNRQDRETSLVGAFEFNKSASKIVHNLWILDDVTTTGATLKESFRAVHKVSHKTRVLGVTVAG